MKKITVSILVIMTAAAIASLFGRIWYILASVAGILGVLGSGISGRTPFSACGFSLSAAFAALAARKNRLLAFAPLILLSFEVWIGVTQHDQYIQCSLSVLDRQLIFTGSATLVLHILLMTILEEVPWRCYYQLNIGRNFPSAAALLLPAAAITLLAVPVYGSEASALCLMGFFLRRLAYGYLFAESGSIVLVIVSHWVTTLFYLVLLVGI